MPPLFDNKNPAAELMFAPSALSREARRQKGLATANVPPVCVLDSGRRHCTPKPLGTATQVGVKFPLPFLPNPIRTSLFTAILVLLSLFTPVLAADYPNRPITLVVAFTPGGPSDVLARIVGKKMEQLLGQPFVIENRPGAGGNLAAEGVAHAVPDGYTLLMGNNSILATNESLYKHLNYRPGKDFVPITLIGTQANILVVNQSVPAQSLKELIALAKEQPGKLNFASSGYGAAAHLAGELFKSEARIDIVHVPYKGAAPALQDVIAGHDQMMFATATSVIGQIEGGRVRALAVTTLKRTQILPDLPTMDEAGLKGFDASTWHGLVAPAGTPPEVIAALHDAAVKALQDKSVQTSLGNLGVDIVGGTPQEFQAYIESEIPKWAAIVKTSGATLENSQ